ncbi:hypothetical protein BJX64DRAFT_297890 [Aspergillus heterothallicus]
MSYNNYYRLNPPPSWNQHAQGSPLQKPHAPIPIQSPLPNSSSLQIQSIPRALEVSFTSISGRHMRVTSETPNGPLLYAADLRTRKPHMLFQETGFPTSTLPASVIFHNFSWTIDATINGANIPMRPVSKARMEYGFTSRALGGGGNRRLTWKMPQGARDLDLDCVEEKTGSVFATWRAHKGWSGRKAGRMEILQPAVEAAMVAGDKGAVDELVVTGLANVYLQIMQVAA